MPCFNGGQADIVAVPIGILVHSDRAVPSVHQNFGGSAVNDGITRGLTTQCIPSAMLTEAS